jgi:hypothetical protein
MAATYTVTFRNDDEWDIEDVGYFSSSDGLLFAAAENSDVVAVFPIASLMGIVRLDGDENDGDDGESADVIHLDESKLGFKITNHFPAAPTSAQVATAMNFASHFPPRTQSKVG